MNMDHSLEEQAVASAVASLSGSGWKRGRDDSADAAGGFKPKVARIAEAPVAVAPVMVVVPLAAPVQVQEEAPLGPAPFFYYKDFSREEDPDPLTPLTPPGRVPNFPAKMHAILSRPDLADVVAWMPHGRSWRVLKPREFEIRVIPTYFEHSKFSSFIRQANGWGFRRVTQGRDRNSYYHEMFLRGLPHLCKNMKRPGVAEKAAADAEHEPDFYQISEMHPVPEKADDDSIMLQCTVQGGPKARMPVYSGALMSTDAFRSLQIGANTESKMPSTETFGLTPKDHSALTSFHQAIAASDNQIRMQNSQESATIQKPVTNMFMPQTSFMNGPAGSFAPSSTIVFPGMDSRAACLAAADRLAFAMQPPQSAAAQSAAAQAAASQFAAGFAAATALSSNHIRNVLGQALAFPGMPQSQTMPTFGNNTN